MKDYRGFSMHGRPEALQGKPVLEIMNYLFAHGKHLPCPLAERKSRAISVEPITLVFARCEGLVLEIQLDGYKEDRQVTCRIYGASRHSVESEIKRLGFENFSESRTPEVY